MKCPCSLRLLGAAAFLAAIAVALPLCRAADPETDPSPLTTEITAKYMDGDWDALETLITQKTREIALLPKDQQADITYIKQALNECHPLWWKQVKLGRKVLIHPTVWQRTLAITYDNATTQNMNFTSTGSQLALNLFWPAADMDSATLAEHNFTKGDLLNTGIWSQLEQASILAGLTPAKVVGLPNAERLNFDRYCGFRGAMTSAYYGTPRAREWAMFLSFDAFLGNHDGQEGFVARKPFAALLEAEIVGHPEAYPSIQLPATLDEETGEKDLALQFLRQFGTIKLTFAEDRALRKAVQQFAAANTTNVYTSGRIAFANKQSMALEPLQDTKLAGKRSAWLANEISNPTVPAKTP